MDELQYKERSGAMSRLLFVDKTRPSDLTPQDPDRGKMVLRYDCKYKFMAALLPSIPFHRLLGRPGLAKPPLCSPALSGVPTRLGSLL